MKYDVVKFPFLKAQTGYSEKVDLKQYIENPIKYTPKDKIPLFIFGNTEGNRHTKESIINRQVIGIDIDKDITDIFKILKLSPFLLYYHTTKSASRERYKNEKGEFVGGNRIRLLIPLSEPIKPILYKQVVAYIIKKLNMDKYADEIDNCSYEASRLLFPPMIPQNGYYKRGHIENPVLNIGNIDLKAEPKTKLKTQPKKEVQKPKIQGEVDASNLIDTTKKAGDIGLFCKTYNIPKAIDKFLSDKLTLEGNRYKPVGSTNTAGISLSKCLNYAFNKHQNRINLSTEHAINSYDLVRILLYCDEDAEDKSSHIKMQELMIKKGIDNKKWLLKLQYEGKGANTKIIDNENNRNIILENNALLKKLFHFNIYSLQVEIRNYIKDKERLKLLNINTNLKNIDVIISKINIYINKFYLKKSTSDSIGKMVNLIAKENEYNPVKERILKSHKKYIEYIKDKELVYKAEEIKSFSPIDRFFNKFYKTEINPLNKEIARLVFKQFIARSLNEDEEGIQADHMLVLIGKQGIGKSTFCQLLGGAYHGKVNFKDIGNKDEQQKLIGLSVVEAEEFAGHKKAEEEAVKSFITEKQRRFRVPYDKATSVFPRRDVIIATTNHENILKDTTGNRRYLVLPVEKGYNSKTYFPWLESMETELVLCIGEAFELYKTDKNLVLPENVQQDMETLNNRHSIDLPDEDFIKDILDFCLEEDINPTYEGIKALFNIKHKTTQFLSKSNIEKIAKGEGWNGFERKSINIKKGVKKDMRRDMLTHNNIKIAKYYLNNATPRANIYHTNYECNIKRNPNFNNYNINENYFD